tara:strand:+ start:2207 stop:3478 length:1272 start_codon:yes stop_codon:yes gene_type:complete
MVGLGRQNQSSVFKGRSKKNGLTPQIILLVIPFCLVALSCFLIASTQRQTQIANWYDHGITALFGLFISLWLSQVSIERLRIWSMPIYILNIISLVLVRILGTSALGAQRWLSIGSINIQPSEIAKLTSIIILAAILERHSVDKPSKLLKPFAVILVPWFLVFLQPDLGTSLVFGAILLFMLYWSGMPIEWGLIVLLLLLTAIFSANIPIFLFFWIPLIGIMAYRSFPRRKLFCVLSMSCHGFIAAFTPWLWSNGLKSYQRDRLILFLDPAKDPLGGGYHLLQSKIGIGSGGLWGTGLMNGQLTKLRFIPEQHTDFIFSAVGEETGFIGTSLVVIAFSILIFRLLHVARNARTDFESLLVIGIAAMFMFQIIVNIFMTIGLGPVTGIPLPFLSYGRTALLVNFSALGLCLSVARRSQLVGRNW